MPKVTFSKPPLTYSDQYNQLISRGLTIPNKEKALHLLESISYYRLSAYLYPLLDGDKTKHVFKKDADFEIAFKLYCFDRHLRKLVVAELEKIEVAVRAKMVYVLSVSYGPFWFKDATLFKNTVDHARSL